MATYTEIHELLNNSDLLDKVQVAVIIASYDINVDAAPPANQAQRLKWAEQTLSQPVKAAQEMWPYVLGANSAADKGVILAASDALILSNVESAIDLFADLIP